MNTRQLLAIEYLNQFGEDIIFKNSYEFYIKGKRGEYIFQKYGDRDDNRIIMIYKQKLLY